MRRRAFRPPAPGGGADGPGGTRGAGARAWGREQALGVLNAYTALRVEVRPPPSRNKWTHRVPHPVLIGHAASLTPY